MSIISPPVVPIVVGGTWESSAGDTRIVTPNTVMLKGVLRNLDPKTFQQDLWVGYPAKYGDEGMPYLESVKIGAQKVEQAVRLVTGSGKFAVLFGYSQGASVVREYLRTCMNTKVLGAGQVADPSRRRDERVVHTDPGGWGITGEGPRPANRAWVLQAAASGDPICALSSNSLLRHIADFSGYFSTDPKEALDWMRRNMDLITSQRWQAANLTWQERFDINRIIRSINEAAGYLPQNVMLNGKPVLVNRQGGRHGVYGYERPPGAVRTYLELLAQHTNSRTQASLALL